MRNSYFGTLMMGNRNTKFHFTHSVSKPHVFLSPSVHNTFSFASLEKFHSRFKFALLEGFGYTSRTYFVGNKCSRISGINVNNRAFSYWPNHRTHLLIFDFIITSISSFWFYPSLFKCPEHKSYYASQPLNYIKLLEEIFRHRIVSPKRWLILNFADAT